MTENLKKLLEEASRNEELTSKLEGLTDKDTALEKTIEIAKEYGFDLTAEDFSTEDGEELSIDEAETVAGGSTFCFGFGAGGKYCGCVAVGGGDSEGRGCSCCVIGVSVSP